MGLAQVPRRRRRAAPGSSCRCCSGPARPSQAAGADRADVPERDLAAPRTPAPPIDRRRVVAGVGGFVVRTDGAARGNPGPASLGAALLDLRRARCAGPARHPDASISDYLGVQTNNVAEYTGIVRALELARELGAPEVHLLLDSKLIVEQLTGRWRVKDAKLIPLWSRARRR